MPKEVAVLCWIAIIGLIAYLIVQFVPLPYPFAHVVIGVAVIMALLMAFRAFGGSIGTPP